MSTLKDKMFDVEIALEICHRVASLSFNSQL